MTRFQYAIEREQAFRILAGKRIGLITNHTGVNRVFQSTAQLLHKQGTLAALFAPEHGIRGDIPAGVEFPDGMEDATLHVPVFSLYGKQKRPSPRALKNLDALAFDIQDVGCRFYTFLTTLQYAMESGLPVVVFDRPNPLGGTRLEGISLEEDCVSFVGAAGIPARYALTIGEYARYLQKRRNIDCELTVIPCIGWKRNFTFSDCNVPWIPPSPNIPTPLTALVYAGTCLVEGTALSEGRGTANPFELIGHPNLNADSLAEKLRRKKLHGVRWRPAHFTPTSGKWAGKLCHGVQIHVTNPRIFTAFSSALFLLQEVREQLPDLGLTEHFDHLLGTKRFRLGTVSTEELVRQSRRNCKVFQKESQEILLYR